MLFPHAHEKLLTENDAASQAASERQTKSYASGSTSFSFFVFWIVTKKTGNKGAETLLGRTHPMLHSVYHLHRLLEDNSMKSYGEEKTHRNSTNNNSTKRSKEKLPPTTPLKCNVLSNTPSCQTSKD